MTMIIMTDMIHLAVFFSVDDDDDDVVESVVGDDFNFFLLVGSKFDSANFLLVPHPVLCICGIICFWDPVSVEYRSLLSDKDTTFHNVKNEKLKKETCGRELEAFEKYLPNPENLGQGCLNLCDG